MAKKKKGKVASSFSKHSRSDRSMRDMKLRDLQKACIVRGMPFEEMVAASVPELHSWFDQHYADGQNLLFLNEFDDWREEHLKRTLKPEDLSWALHPQLRLGFIGEKDNEGNVISTKKPRLKGVDKAEKPKRERIEGTKVFSGTKKALTYQLAVQHLKDKKLPELTIPEVVAQVIEAFPEAQEKSIKIWRKRALNEFA